MPTGLILARRELFVAQAFRPAIPAGGFGRRVLTQLVLIALQDVGCATEEKEVDTAVAEYLEIGAFIDRGRSRRAGELDLESFSKATARVLTDDQKS